MWVGTGKGMTRRCSGLRAPLPSTQRGPHPTTVSPQRPPLSSLSSRVSPYFWHAAPPAAFYCSPPGRALSLWRTSFSAYRRVIPNLLYACAQCTEIQTCGRESPYHFRKPAHLMARLVVKARCPGSPDPQAGGLVMLLF